MPLLHGFGIFAGAGVAATPGIGYLIGLGQAGDSYPSTIYKFPFATETWAASSETLVADGARSNTAHASSPTAGYLLGGRNAPDANRSDIVKVLWSDDTSSIIAPSLSVGRRYQVGFQSQTAGYAAGGYKPPPFAITSQVSTVDKISFSTDSTSTTPSGLSVARRPGGNASSPVAGYVVNGVSSPNSNLIQATDKYNLSTDVRTTVSPGLGLDRLVMTCFSSTVAGYMIGGWDGTYTISSMQKLTFATDTFATVSSAVDFNLSDGAGFSSLVAGYRAGGNNRDTPARTDTVDKFDFSDDTRSATTAIPVALTGNNAGHSTTPGFL